MNCSVCAHEGLYQQASVKDASLLMCRLHFLESNWRGRTKPVAIEAIRKRRASSRCAAPYRADDPDQQTRADKPRNQVADPSA